jgi:hypothetical protein
MPSRYRIYTTPKKVSAHLELLSLAIDELLVREVRWEIEILREGNSIGEHLARFKPGGAYQGWVARRRTVPQKTSKIPLPVLGNEK